MTGRWNRVLWTATLIGTMAAVGPRAAWSHAADEAAPPPGAVVIAPRTEARVGQTEIVMVFSKQILAVFLSRYDDDLPIVGAKVEASTDLQTAPLKETDPGVYSTTDLLMSSGRNDLTVKFTVDGKTVTQAMPLMMPVEAPVPAAPSPVIASATPLTIGGAIVAVYALLSAAFLVARRRTPRTGRVGAGAGARTQTS